MGKYRDLNTGDIFPASWTDAIQEFISTMASANFALGVVAAGNAVTLPAGAGDDQVSLGIMGRWRYNVAAANSTAIAGGTAAGTYPVYATAADNVFGGGDVDSTVYSFAMEIRTAGGVPSAAIYRQIANVGWNGFGITGVLPLVGRNNYEVLVGTSRSWTGDGDPVDTRYLLAEGRLIASASYPIFDAQAGGKAIAGKTHKYNGGVDPGGGMVRIPDKRGRASVGADNMGTAQGAASRLTTAKGHNNVIGQNGGFERHQLAATESGVPAHAVSVAGNFTGISIGPQLGNILGDDGNASGTTFGFTTSAGNLVKRQTQYSLSDPSHGHTASAGAAAAAAEHNNMGPYEVDNVIVRVK